MMKFSKKIFVSTAILLSFSFAFAQNNSEISAEEDYLTDLDGEIISTLADSDEYDNKLVALQYLEAALEEGNTSDSVIRAMDKLAGEGLTSQTRTKGRLSNNFPEIRREACLLMAKVPTEHTKNTLTYIAVNDAEPMVIAAAVKSLGEIGINNNDEAVDAIVYANKRNRALNPTSSLAFEVLNAFELLADSTENKKSMLDEISYIATNYKYNTAVRQKAQKLLKTLSPSASSSDSKKKNNSEGK